MLINININVSIFPWLFLIVTLKSLIYKTIILLDFQVVSIPVFFFLANNSNKKCCANSYFTCLIYFSWKHFYKCDYRVKCYKSLSCP